MPSTYSAPSAPRASQSGINIVADTRALGRLARDLRRGAPMAWKAYRVAVIAAVQPVAADARSRASFSTRIPATIKVRVTSGGNVKIVAGGTGAPDAAPLENKGRSGTFRHPTWGHRDRWVEQAARPFLAPAFEAHKDMVLDAIEEAVHAAVELAVKGGGL